MKPLTVALLVSIAISAAYGGHGSRKVVPIQGPNDGVVEELGSGSTVLAPVSPEKLKPALQGVLRRWNTPDMQRDLAAGFRDKERLLDSVNSVVPRDATVRLLSLRGVQTLSQSQRTENGRSERVSVVSATASTQLEYQGSNGLVRLPGVNEFILEVIEPVGGGGAP